MGKQFQAQSGVSEIVRVNHLAAQFPAQSGVSEISAAPKGQQFQAQSSVSEVGAAPKGKPSQIESEYYHYILELQDKGTILMVSRYMRMAAAIQCLIQLHTRYLNLRDRKLSVPNLHRFYSLFGV
jgi:hypothetical protein